MLGLEELGFQALTRLLTTSTSVVRGPLHVQHDSEFIPNKHKADMILTYTPECLRCYIPRQVVQEHYTPELNQRKVLAAEQR